MAIKASFYSSYKCSDYFKLDEVLSEEEASYRRSFANFPLTSLESEYEAARFPLHLLPSLFSSSAAGAHLYGASAMQCGLAAMELAKKDAGIATFLCILQTISMIAIHECGSEEQKNKWLHRIAGRKAKHKKQHRQQEQQQCEAEVAAAEEEDGIVACFGLTEPLRGSDANPLTTATPVSNSSKWILNGTKRWIGSAPFADIAIIFAANASVPNGIVGFIVDMHDKTKGTGLSVSTINNKIGFRIVQNGEIHFSNYEIDETNRLPFATTFQNGPGKCLFLTRLIAGWIAIGQCMGAFDYTLDYLANREQFGASMLHLQLIQEKLMRCLGIIQAMISLAWRTSKLYDNKTLTFGQVGLFKGTVTRMAREVLANLREMMGANGLLATTLVGKHFVDLEAVHTFEGTYDINMLYVTAFDSISKI